MKSLLHINVFCIGVIYVYGQVHIGEHAHELPSGIHIDVPHHHGNEQNQPKLSDVLSKPRHDRVPGRTVRLNQRSRNNGMTRAIAALNLDRLLRKQSKQLLREGTPIFGIVDNKSVLLTKENNKKGNGKGNGKRNGKGDGGRRGGRRGRKRGNKRRKTTTTTTTTTIAPKKSGGNGGITIIRTSRPNPFQAIGNALRSALNIGGGGGGVQLGPFVRPNVGVRPIFGGLFGGKR